MNLRLKLVVLLLLSAFLLSVPTIDGSSSGKHNQANQGCTCHQNGGAITPTHNFPSSYNPGQAYSISINLNNGTQSFNGGFNVLVNKGQLSNPGSNTQINGQGNSATHSASNSLGWTFDWIGPTPGSGAVTVHIAVLQADASGTNSGDAWSTLQLTINEFQPPNDPPVAYDLNITPSPEAPSTSDLTLTYQYADPNMDAESGTLIHWYKNNTQIPGLDGMMTISSIYTSAGDTWKVEVTPSDGTDFGQTEVTSEVTIVDVDSDNDGVFDSEDAFPNDPNESQDSDNDGVGDNGDAFPNDPNETMDSDSDGVGDNADAFPNDPNETMDSDLDGVGDNADAFPFDPNEDSDSDMDGVGDNADAFPNDPNEDTDSDMDGVGDNADAFPNDPTEDTDSDNDTVGDNSDAFPFDPTEDTDSDNDTVGDNADAFPNDPAESADSDMDGVGDNADAFPNDANETLDSDMDGVGNKADVFPTDANETKDSDMDGVGDNADKFPNNPAETKDSDMDGVGDNADKFPNDATETVDSDGDGVGDNADAFPNDATETMDSDGDGVGDNADAFPNDVSETLDSDGDGVGDNAQALAEASVSEEDSSNLMLIIGIIGAVIAVLIGGVLFMKSRTPGNAFTSDEPKDYTTEMSSFSGNPFQTYQPVAEVSQPVAQVSQPVMPVQPVAELSVLQQWTDASGHTWRQMSDSTIEWWNGTDWQKT